MNWKSKQIKVSDLKEWKKNPRHLTADGLAQLKESIQKFGIAEPIVVNTDLTICGGHGRKKVLEQLGMLYVDCYVPEVPLTDKQFEELNIRLNKNIAGKFDFDILANEFEVDDLLEWGFDADDLQIKTEEIDFDDDDDEKEVKRCPNCDFILT